MQKNRLSRSIWALFAILIAACGDNSLVTTTETTSPHSPFKTEIDLQDEKTTLKACPTEFQVAYETLERQSADHKADLNVLFLEAGLNNCKSLSTFTGTICKLPSRNVATAQDFHNFCHFTEEVTKAESLPFCEDDKILRLSRSIASKYKAIPKGSTDLSTIHSAARSCETFKKLNQLNRCSVKAKDKWQAIYIDPKKTQDQCRRIGFEKVRIYIEDKEYTGFRKDMPEPFGTDKCSDDSDPFVDNKFRVVKNFHNAFSSKLPKLTNYWAQKMIGMPEVFEFIQGLKKKPRRVAIGLIDSGFDFTRFNPNRLSKEIATNTFSEKWRADNTFKAAGAKTHGTSVAHLLIGNPPMGVALNGYITGVSKYASNQQKAHKELFEQGYKPEIVSSSVYSGAWYGFPKDYKLFEDITDQALKFRSAGNSYPAECPTCYKSGNAIIVGNLDPDGDMTASSCEDTCVDISAPSSIYLQSWESINGRLFGGTSGSAPLVAASATLVVGFLPGLTIEELRAMFKHTAIKTTGAFGDGRTGNGVGALNTYKMVRVAEKLRKGWPENRKLLHDVATYNFRKEAAELLLKSQPLSLKTDCDSQRQTMQLLRKAVFLMPELKNARNALGLLYDIHDYKVEAQYYSTDQFKKSADYYKRMIAQGIRDNNTELIKKAINSGAQTYGVRIDNMEFLCHLYERLDPKLMVYVKKRVAYDSHLLSHLRNATAERRAKVLDALFTIRPDTKASEVKFKAFFKQAMAKAEAPVMRVLLKHGLHLETDYKKGKLIASPLVHSVLNEEQEMVDALLKHKADTSATDDRGMTAVELAIRSGNFVLGDSLVAAWAEQNKPLTPEKKAFIDGLFQKYDFLPSQPIN